VSRSARQLQLVARASLAACHSPAPHRHTAPPMYAAHPTEATQPQQKHARHALPLCPLPQPTSQVLSPSQSSSSASRCALASAQ
jgi:hypothetical protein